MGGGCSKDGGSDGASEPSAAPRPRALPIRPPDAARCRAGRPGDAPSEPTVDRKHTEPEPATLDGDAAPLMGEPWAQVAAPRLGPSQRRAQERPRRPGAGAAGRKRTSSGDDRKRSAVRIQAAYRGYAVRRRAEKFASAAQAHSRIYRRKQPPPGSTVAPTVASPGPAALPGRAPGWSGDDTKSERIRQWADHAAETATGHGGEVPSPERHAVTALSASPAQPSPERRRRSRAAGSRPPPPPDDDNASVSSMGSTQDPRTWISSRSSRRHRRGARKSKSKNKGSGSGKAEVEYIHHQSPQRRAFQPPQAGPQYPGGGGGGTPGVGYPYNPYGPPAQFGGGGYGPGYGGGGSPGSGYNPQPNFVPQGPATWSGGQFSAPGLYGPPQGGGDAAAQGPGGNPGGPSSAGLGYGMPGMQGYGSMGRGGMMGGMGGWSSSGMPGSMSPIGEHQMPFQQHHAPPQPPQPPQPYGGPGPPNAEGPADDSVSAAGSISVAEERLSRIENMLERLAASNPAATPPPPR